MTGLHGAWLARLVNVPSATAIKRIVSTAIGRRFQLFSPSPEKKGSTSKTINAITGPISRTGVSSDGGSNDKRAKSHRKKKSGRGDVWMTRGSGWPVGPNGPKYRAQAAMARRITPEKTTSFQTPYGRNGTP